MNGIEKSQHLHRRYNNPPSKGLVSLQKTVKVTEIYVCECENVAVNNDDHIFLLVDDRRRPSTHQS